MPRSRATGSLEEANVPRKPTVVCFDLEGPLTAEDYGFRLLAETVSAGQRIFAVLSHYVLIECNRAGYEPGDTMALILPFLAANGLQYDDFVSLAEKCASTIVGAEQTIAYCRQRNWRPHIISASYEPFAHAVARLVGLPMQYVHCTRLSQEHWRRLSGREGRAATLAVEESIRSRFPPGDLMLGLWDKEIVDLLNTFFYSQLPQVGYPHPGDIVRPLGGRRKAQSLESIARRNRISLSAFAYVGDSINDAAAFRCLDALGGLAVSFNGNHYALGSATVGVASEDLTAILPVLDAWETGRGKAVRALASQPPPSADGHWAWLPDLRTSELEATVIHHAAIRHIVRASAAGLG
jgi:energy-converting hydrogenase A subunit R